MVLWGSAYKSDIRSSVNIWSEPCHFLPLTCITISDTVEEIHCVSPVCIRTGLWGRDPFVAGVWRGVWRCTRSFNFRIWQVHTHLQYKCSNQEKKKSHTCAWNILKQSSSQTVVVNLHGEFFFFFSWLEAFKALPALRQPKQPVKTTQSL